MQLITGRNLISFPIPRNLECVAKPSLMAARFGVETLALFALFVGQSTHGYVTIIFMERLWFATPFSD